MYQKAINQGEVSAVALDIPGVTIKTLHTDVISGATIVLTSIAAGATIPKHWHSNADETVFVISGDFIEEGESYGPGALFVGKARTAHGPHSSALGCVVLSTFSAPLDFKMGEPDSETT